MREVEIAFKPTERQDKDSMLSRCATACGLSKEAIVDVEPIRKSVDARAGKILYRYRMSVLLKGDAIPAPFKSEPYKDSSSGEEVLVIGAGPAGLFAALTLLQRGIKPIILERGKDVHSRKRDTAQLSLNQIVNPDSNYCFGEGGAGTFSDGKLYTRSTKRGDIKEVLYQLVQFGASPSILTDAHPHIGSDKLPTIIEAVHKTIISYGGEIHLNCRVVDIIQHRSSKGKITYSVICKDLCKGSEIEFSAGNVILACGHSAKDIYELFYRKGWTINAKGFALGVRAEHPQSLINDIQYHRMWQPYLPPAEYFLTAQVDGRGVFSFCMCPGGIVLPSVTSAGEVLVNGMSNSLRNSKWANAGIVTSVEPEDVKGFDEFGELRVLKFQESVEQKIFEQNGGSLRVPAARMTDFVRGRLSDDLPPTSYKPGVYSAPLDDILPADVASRLRRAFPLFDKKMRGYYTSQSLLLAVESRTSSPVRIPRDPDTLQHVTLSNLYPCGEGAGYSGGIVSSAVDGINVARRITL